MEYGFSKALWKALQSKGFSTVKEMSDYLEIDYSTVHDLLYYKRYPSWLTLCKIIRKFDELPIDHWFKED